MLMQIQGIIIRTQWNLDLGPIIKYIYCIILADIEIILRVNVKRFYLLLYSIALRFILHVPLKLNSLLVFDFVLKLDINPK